MGQGGHIFIQQLMLTHLQAATRSGIWKVVLAKTSTCPPTTSCFTKKATWTKTVLGRNFFVQYFLPPCFHFLDWCFPKSRSILGQKYWERVLFFWYRSVFPVFEQSHTDQDCTLKSKVAGYLKVCRMYILTILINNVHEYDKKFSQRTIVGMYYFIEKSPRIKSF